MKTILRKTLRAEDVRGVCIDHNYYTCGDNREYSEMFSMLNRETRVTHSNITGHTLQRIAEDIKDHSDTEETVEDILWALSSKIRVTPYVIED